MMTLFRNPRRTFCVPLIGALILSTAAADAALLAYEPFTNSTGTAIIGGPHQKG